MSKHVIGQKIHVKSWRFQCEMEKIKKKNDNLLVF